MEHGQSVWTSALWRSRTIGAVGLRLMLQWLRHGYRREGRTHRRGARTAGRPRELGPAGDPAHGRQYPALYGNRRRRAKAIFRRRRAAWLLLGYRHYRLHPALRSQRGLPADGALDADPGPAGGPNPPK